MISITSYFIVKRGTFAGTKGARLFARNHKSCTQIHIHTFTYIKQIERKTSQYLFSTNSRASSWCNRTQFLYIPQLFFYTKKYTFIFIWDKKTLSFEAPRGDEGQQIHTNLIIDFPWEGALNGVRVTNFNFMLTHETVCF